MVGPCPRNPIRGGWPDRVLGLSFPERVGGERASCQHRGQLPIGLQAGSSADASARRSGPSLAEGVTLASPLCPQTQYPLKLGMLEPQGSERLQRPAKHSGPVGCIL